jgi:hypothetical protein
MFIACIGCVPWGVYFRKYPYAQLQRTSAITDTVSHLLVRYNEGLMYCIVDEIFRRDINSCQPQNKQGT